MAKGSGAWRVWHTLGAEVARGPAPALPLGGFGTTPVLNPPMTSAAGNAWRVRHTLGAEVARGPAPALPPEVTDVYRTNELSVEAGARLRHGPVFGGVSFLRSSWAGLPDTWTFMLGVER